MIHVLHYFALGLAFGAITVIGLAGAVRLDRYEAAREAAWRAAQLEPTDIGEKSGDEPGTAFTAGGSSPTLTVIDGGASDRGL